MRLLSVAAARLLSGRGGLQQHRGCCRVIGLCIQRTDCTRLKGTGSCLFGGLFQTRSSDADVQVGKHAPAEQSQLRTHKLDSQELPGRDAHLAPSQLPPQACLVLLEWNHGPVTHEHMFSTCWCLHVAMHSLGKLEQLSDQSGLDTKPGFMHSLDGHHAHQQLPTMHIKCWTTSHRPEPKNVHYLRPEATARHPGSTLVPEPGTNRGSRQLPAVQPGTDCSTATPPTLKP